MARLVLVSDSLDMTSYRCCGWIIGCCRTMMQSVDRIFGIERVVPC